MRLDLFLRRSEYCLACSTCWVMPKWRNWQTRWTQNPVPAREWGFDSPLRHHTQTGWSPGLFFSKLRSMGCPARPGAIALTPPCSPRPCQCPSENSIGPQWKVYRAGWGGLPQRTQRCLGRGGCSGIGAVISHCLGLLKHDIYKIPQKICVQSMELTHPDMLVENATAPSAGGFPDPDGEDSRRDRRGRRGVWGGGKATYIGAVFNNCPGLPKRYDCPPQKIVGCRAWNLPTLIGWSKTPPRSLREAFRIRMGMIDGETRSGSGSLSESESMGSAIRRGMPMYKSSTAPPPPHQGDSR